jgi:TetR/AcrR family transcriptional regulator, transcriptional repressor for nem operon
MATSTTRDDIVDAADRLFYQRGFDHTSFTEIADEVRISRGNFYYHFRTKDEILAAVIAARAARTQAMLDAWSAECPSPAGRLRCFVDMVVHNEAAIRRHGCPVGTLQTELAKLDHASRDAATGLFTMFRDWLRQQFVALGHGRHADALAMHLLMRSQGIALLAQAFDDERFLRREARELMAWLDALAAPAPASARRRPSASRRPLSRRAA